MDPLTRLIICGLAVFRLAEMLVIDDGPFGIFVELRGWLQRGTLDDGLKIYVNNVKAQRWIDGRVGLVNIRREIFSGITCVYCVGVWFAFIFAFLFYFQNVWTDLLIIFLAIAGLQSILATKLGRH